MRYLWKSKKIVYCKTMSVIRPINLTSKFEFDKICKIRGRCEFKRGVIEWRHSTAATIPFHITEAQCGSVIICHGLRRLLHTILNSDWTELLVLWMDHNLLNWYFHNNSFSWHFIIPRLRVLHITTLWHLHFPLHSPRPATTEESTLWSWRRPCPCPSSGPHAKD